MGASSDTLIKFYKAFIRPVLETGYICTAQANPSTILKLQRKQNWILGIGFRQPRRTSTKKLHELSACETIQHRLEKLRNAALVRYQDSKLTNDLNLRRSLLEKLKL